MIVYTTGRWNLKLLVKVEGSVFPKALVWSIPAAIHSVVFHYLWFEVGQMKALERISAFGAVWSSFAFVLGFLTVFRTQQAHSRYWEGATSIQQARANFFNAFSSVIAFCAADPERRHRVESFQHLFARLMSMLHCVALQNVVSEPAPGQFEFFNTDGIDPRSLRFLTSHSDVSRRGEIIIQWIQQLVVTGSRDGTIDVPPPILTRFFQELSQGAVQIINARNMTAIPFPFPYAQLLTMLMLAFWLVSPIFFALLLDNPAMSASFAFLTTFAFWGTNYIAAELESPFGDDPNDLPLYALQRDMNKSLWALLNPLAQSAPKFEFHKDTHREWDVIREIPEEQHSRESKCKADSVDKSKTNKTWLHARDSGVSAVLRRLSTRVSNRTLASRMSSIDSMKSIPDGDDMSNAYSMVEGTKDRGSRQHTDRGVDQRAEEPATSVCAISPAEISVDDCEKCPARKTCAVPSTEVSLDDLVDGLEINLPAVARDVNDYVRNVRVALKSLIEHTIRDLQLLQTNVEWTEAYGPNDLDRLGVASLQEAQLPVQFPAIQAIARQRSGFTSQRPI